MYTAEEALDKGLIDAVETREAFVARVKKEIDGPVVVNNRYGRKKGPQINLANPLAFFSVLAEMFKTPERSQKDAVAVVYVEGAIMSGHSQPSPFGSTSGAFSGDIRKALETAKRALCTLGFGEEQIATKLVVRQQSKAMDIIREGEQGLYDAVVLCPRAASAGDRSNRCRPR